ncbi:MAG: bacillithiol biosynthesis deacetylase BshB1 [Aureispira sp.]|nr:bacillithiol biosynthesis deacetylase BshB1 [Aureispira sp.]
MNVDILAIGVHPDDIELSCSGTLLQHIALGYKVALLDLTCGELGTRGSAELRLEEAAVASKMLGAVVRGNLEFEDGFFEHNQENLIKIIEMIRFLKPKIILANAVSDRHPDHGRAAKLVSDACFLSGLVKIETELYDEPQQPWRPDVVYHYIQDHNLKPDFVVDISPFMNQKLEIIQAYKSQFFDPESKEPETPISSKDFLEFIKSKNRTYGRPAGFEFGEGFTVARTIGVHSLFNIK